MKAGTGIDLCCTTDATMDMLHCWHEVKPMQRKYHHPSSILSHAHMLPPENDDLEQH